MTFQITVVDNITNLSVTEEPVVISEQVAGVQGTAGVVAADSPVTYNSTTKRVGFDATGFVKTAIANIFTVGGQIIRTGSDAVKGLTISRNSASQSANLLSITGSDGTTEIARIRPNGQLGVGSQIGNALLALNEDQLGDNRGIVIKAGVSNPSNNFIEILPLANNTPFYSVTNAGVTIGNGFVDNTMSGGAVYASSSGYIQSMAQLSAELGGTGTTTGLTVLNASNLTSGTVPNARISGTLPNVTSVNSTTIPASANLVTSTAYRQSQHTPTGSVDIVPRYQVTGTRTLTSGTAQLTGFTPIADMTLTKITTVVTAVTGATSLQYALFSVSGTTVTCIATTAVSGTPTTGLMELSFSTGQSLTAGTNYLIGFLAVGGTSVTVAGVTTQANLVLQGNGTAGTVLAPLIAAASSSTTLTAMPSAGNTLAIGAGNIASFAYARLN